MILVIDQRDSLVRHDSGVLRIERDGVRRGAPIRQLELVVVYGNPLVETAVWRKLAAAGVPAVLHPARGRDASAVLAGGLATQLPLRLNQHRLAADPDTALKMARWVLHQKFTSYELPLGPLLEVQGAGEKACDAFRRRRDETILKLDRVSGIDEAMGLEGQLARAWFGLIAETLTGNWRFQGRNRRPPRDPVNALLSLGYTLVQTEVQQAVCAAGLDPSLGFLHQPAPGREAMVLDITEIFRTGVDHFVLGWIEPRGPDPRHWLYRATEGCRLSKQARPGYFGAWAEYRRHWPHPLRGDLPADEEWPISTLREQIRGWIERLRAELKLHRAEENLE